MKSKFSFFTAVILVTGSAIAGPPEKYDRCNSRINVPYIENSQGVFFDKDCKTAYVLPPVTGKLLMSVFVPTAPTFCAPIRGQLDELSDNEKRIKAIKAAASIGAGGPLGGYGGSSARLVLSDSQIAEIDKLRKRNKEMMADLLTYESYEGGQLNVLLDVGQRNIIQKYVEAMPGVSVRSMPLEVAYLSFAKPSSEGKLQFVKWLKIPGLKASNEKSGAFEVSDSESSIMGESKTGSMGLSLLGVCSFYDIERDELVTPNIQEVAKLIAGNVSFAYNLQVRAHYTAEYNMSAMVSRIAKQESSGGFFDSSTVTSLIEDRHSEDWFKFEGEYEDSSMVKEDLAQTVKTQIIERLLKNAKAIGFGENGSIPDKLAPQPHGAEVAAQELQKCPHLYCQIGAGVLHFADAVFGSTEAMQTYISKNNFWAKETVSESKAFTYRGTMTFK